MAKVMFQFRQPGAAPTLAEVCQIYALRPEEVDAEFGVVQTDSQDGLFVVLIEDTAQTRLNAQLSQLGWANDPAIGVFANPPVEPFDPSMEAL